MTKNKVKIVVRDVFTKTPGGRLREDGPYSGEEFRDDILIPALEAHPDETVEVDLDGTCGYAASFLEEVFGGLIRRGVSPYRSIKLVANEEPYLIDEIHKYTTEAATDFICSDLEKAIRGSHDDQE